MHRAPTHNPEAHHTPLPDMNPSQHCTQLQCIKQACVWCSQHTESRSQTLPNPGRLWGKPRKQPAPRACMQQRHTGCQHQLAQAMPVVAAGSAAIARARQACCCNRRRRCCCTLLLLTSAHASCLRRQRAAPAPSGPAGGDAAP